MSYKQSILYEVILFDKITQSIYRILYPGFTFGKNSLHKYNTVNILQPAKAIVVRESPETLKEWFRVSNINVLTIEYNNLCHNDKIKRNMT